MKPTIEVTISNRLHLYLKECVEMEGFGESVEKVAERFLWDRVNDLIAAGRFSFVPPERRPTRNV